MERAYTLIAYTYGGQKSEERSYMLIPYTCGGQKSTEVHAQTLIAYTYVGKSLPSALQCFLHTPAEGNYLGHKARHPYGCFHMTLGVLYQLLEPLTDEIPRKWPKRPLFSFRAR